MKRLMGIVMTLIMLLTAIPAWADGFSLDQLLQDLQEHTPVIPKEDIMPETDETSSIQESKQDLPALKIPLTTDNITVKDGIFQIVADHICLQAPESSEWSYYTQDILTWPYPEEILQQYEWMTSLIGSEFHLVAYREPDERLEVRWLIRNWVGLSDLTSDTNGLTDNDAAILVLLLKAGGAQDVSMKRIGTNNYLEIRDIISTENILLYGFVLDDVEMYIQVRSFNGELKDEDIEAAETLISDFIFTAK